MLVYGLWEGKQYWVIVISDYSCFDVNFIKKFCVSNHKNLIFMQLRVGRV